MKPSSGVKPPYAHHDDVARLARTDLDLGQRCRTHQFRLQGRALEQQGTQTATAVRIDQSHAEPPQNMVFREGAKVNKSPIHTDAIISIWG
jgi:hypothetical protein